MTRYEEAAIYLIEIRKHFHNVQLTVHPGTPPLYNLTAERPLIGDSRLYSPWVWGADVLEVIKKFWEEEC